MADVKLNIIFSAIDRGVTAASGALKGGLAGNAQAMTALGGVAVGVGGAIQGALLGAAYSAANYGDEIAKAAAKTGMTTEAISGLRFAAEQSGVEFGQLEMALARMQRSAAEAADGSAMYADAYRALGVNVRGANGQLKDGETLFLDLAQALSNVDNPTQRAALAMQIFGRSGAQLLPLLNEGQAGITELTERAQELGLVMDQDTAAAAERFNDMLDEVKGSLRGVAVQIGQHLFPIIADLAESLASVIGAFNEWADAHPTLAKAVVLTAGAIGVLLAQGGALLILLAQLAPIVTALSGAGGMAGLAGGIGGASGALAGIIPLLAAVGPWIIAAAAVAGLVIELIALKRAYDAAAAAGRQMQADLAAQQQAERNAAQGGYADAGVTARQQAEVQQAESTMWEVIQGMITPGGVTGRDFARQRVANEQQSPAYLQIQQGGNRRPERIEFPLPEAPRARPAATYTPNEAWGGPAPAWRRQAAANGGTTINVNVHGDIYDAQRFEERVGRVVGRTVGR